MISFREPGVSTINTAGILCYMKVSCCCFLILYALLLEYDRTWYPLRLQASQLNGGAPPLLPFIPADKWKLKDRQKQKRNEMKRYEPTAATPRTWVSISVHSIPPIIWAGTSQLQSLPRCQSPLDRTVLWETTLRSACGSICLHSSLSPFPPCSRVHSAGLSTGCDGGRGAPASGPLSLFTSRICCLLGGCTVLGRLQWVHPHIYVGEIWQPATSRLSLEMVSWSPSCPWVCSWSAYCTSRPPSLLWVLTFPRRFI